MATAFLALSTTMFADVKIKKKQTISGKTTEKTTYIKGKRQRTEMMGGEMISVSQCDVGRDLQIAPQSKTYTVSYYDDGTDTGKTSETQKGNSGSTTTVPGGTMNVTTTITDTGERKQMLGFTARHIIQTIETETTRDACRPVKTKTEMELWVIDAEFVLPCSQTRQYRPNKVGKSGGCIDKMVSKTIGSAKSGYPLWQKTTMYDANGKELFSTVEEVVEISNVTLDQALFEAPSDYREVKNPSEMVVTGGKSQSSGQSYSAKESSSPISANIPLPDPGSSPGNVAALKSAMSSGAKPATSGQPNSTNPPSPPISSNVLSQGPDSSPGNAAASKSDVPKAVGTKKSGTIRLGLAGIKTASVGEGINAAELSSAIQNSLGEHLKGTKVEIVPLDAKLASAQSEEGKLKGCDYVILLTASHKRGGGGSGSGKVPGQAATLSIVTAASISRKIKSKDELTLDLKLQSIADNGTPFTKQFKAMAKGDGDDIITAIVEQAARAIVDAVGK